MLQLLSIRTEATLTGLQSRLEALNAFVASSRMPDPRPNMSGRTVAKTLLDMEIYVNMLIDDPRCKHQLSVRLSKIRSDQI